MVSFLLTINLFVILFQTQYSFHHLYDYLQARTSYRLFAKSSGKGFGKTKPKSDSSSNNILDNSIPTFSLETTGNSPISKTLENDNIEPSLSKDSDLDTLIKNTEMFKSKREYRENILQSKIEQLKQEDDLIASDPSVGAVPELVANRMLGRIITFFGIPVFGGLLIFVAAYFVSKKYDIVIPPMIVAYVTQVPFLVGLLGISYAILSSSWDEDEGSVLGIEEFKINLKRIQEGLTKTREIATLRQDIEEESERLGENLSKRK